MPSNSTVMPSDAQNAYSVSLPRGKAKRGKKQDNTADTLAKLLALANAGLLRNMLPQRRGAKRGGFDIAEIMKLYAQYKPVIDVLLPLIEKLFKKENKPVIDNGGDDGKLPPGAEDEDQPAPPASNERFPTKLQARVFWVSRKHQPGKVGGGRYLISDADKAKVVSGADPLQQGDRVCFDVTPVDQNGKAYVNEKPVEIEHEVGGVGELQQQELSDFTPVVLVPNVGNVVVPGFQGELTYRARGGGLESNLIKLRVRPWKA